MTVAVVVEYFRKRFHFLPSGFSGQKQPPLFAKTPQSPASGRQQFDRSDYVFRGAMNMGGNAFFGCVAGGGVSPNFLEKQGLAGGGHASSPVSYRNCFAFNVIVAHAAMARKA